MSIEEARAQQLKTGVTLSKASTELRIYYTLDDVTELHVSKKPNANDFDSNGRVHDLPAVEFVFASNYEVDSMHTTEDKGKLTTYTSIHPEHPAGKYIDAAMYTIIKKAGKNLYSEFGDKKAASLVNDMAYYDYKAPANLKGIKPFLDELNNNNSIHTLTELHDSLQKKHPDNNLLGSKEKITDNKIQKKYIKALVSLGGNKNEILMHAINLLTLGSPDSLQKRKITTSNILQGSDVFSYAISQPENDIPATSSIETMMNLGCSE